MTRGTSLSSELSHSWAMAELEVVGGISNKGRELTLFLNLLIVS